MLIEPRIALYDHLKSNSNVTAALAKCRHGLCLYQGRVSSGAKKPLAVVQPPISRVPTRILSGVAYKQQRLQVTVVADTQPEAEVTAQAIIAAVEGFTGTMAGLDVMLATVDNDRQVFFDEVDEVYHHVDVMILYRDTPAAAQEPEPVPGNDNEGNGDGDNDENGENGGEIPDG